MANTIQIKRSASTATPTSLAAGELAYSENSLKLFIGESSNSVRVVGGEGAFLRSDTNDTLNGNLVVTGNLTVQGSTTTIESNTISVGDNIIVLNNDETGTPTQDAGVEIERGTADNAQFIWDETNNYWRPKVGSSAADIKSINDLSVDNDASVTGNLAVDGTSNLDDTDIDGTLAVDGASISLDATTSLNIDNSNTTNGVTIATATSSVPVTIGHATSEVTFGDNITVTGNATIGESLLPDSNNGATIGGSTSRFANMYSVLADINTLAVNTAATVATLQVSDLTNDRVMIAGSSGEVEDSANLTFNGSLLNITGNATVSGTLDVNTDATIATAKIEDLTSGRVVLAGTGGEIEDSGNLTFNGSTLTVTGGATVTGALDVNTSATIATLQVEDLTSGRVVLAGTNGEIEDSANLTFNGSTLALTGSQTISSALTVSGAFTSQGIDDNATQETLQIDNTNVKIMASGVTLGGYASGTKSVIDNFVVDGGTF